MIAKRDILIDYLKGCDDKVFELKVHREKRSLNANAYCWALINKIADLTRSSREEIYLLMLKRYGQSDLIQARADVNLGGFVKYFEEISNDGKYKTYVIYKGSSEYNTKEMAVLIDGIVSECNELAIDVIPREEIERLKELWNQ